LRQTSIPDRLKYPLKNPRVDGSIPSLATTFQIIEA